MTKTPYELRYDLLQTAMGYLRDQYISGIETARSLADMGYHAQLKAVEAITYPSMEDAFKLAAKMKDFIETK